MSSEQIITLVVVITVVDFFIIGTCAVVMIRKSRSVSGEMEESAIRSGEGFKIKPESAMFTGSTARFGRIKGNGTIALTDKRLVFQKLIGGAIEISLTEIDSVSDNLWFQGQFRNFHKHLILTLKDGTKVGFMVKNHDEWMQKMRDLIST